MWRAATHLLNLLYNWYHYGSKNGQIGYDGSAFMSMFYAYILGFSVAIYKQN